ncbi:hypothetical protein FSP39_023513 [Pinctada imbricata]|uniref:Uncharacterized protein n=1 Tax=Pinctada imbricata TaxID=66713 RepID=A0AA89C2P5_PINIB|nr:hypothetical protein FSP39_023513 [Pinctada imbricata]
MTSIQEVLDTVLKDEEGGSTSQISNKFYCLHSLDQTLNTINLDSSTDRLKQITAVSSLLNICPVFWIEEYVNLYNTPSNRKVFGQSMTRLLTKAHATAVTGKDHYQYESADFLHTPEFATSVMTLIDRVLEVAFSESVKGLGFLSWTLPRIAILLLEHRENNLWTSAASVSVASCIMTKLKFHFLLEDFLSLFGMDCESFIFDRKHQDFNHEAVLRSLILKEICTVLTKEKWKANPAYVSVFTALLFFSKFPDLSDHIVQVLPPSLMFIDDFVLQNKILGVRCLHHIVTNTSREELRWYGRADVIYEALKHQLYTHKASMIRALHQAILAILKVVEKDPCAMLAGGDTSVNKYDEIYQMIVHDAQGEQNLAMRLAFTEHLPEFVQIMGVTSVKHISISLSLVSDYLEVYDGSKDSARINILNLLEKIIQSSWPRIQSHQNQILQMLIKLLIDISMDQTESLEPALKDALISRATKCMCLLKYANPDIVNETLSTLKSVTLPKLVHITIDHVIKAQAT